MKDEKEELARRALRHGEGFAGAARLLRDYMVEKDSPMPIKWRRDFVKRVIEKINQEARA